MTNCSLWQYLATKTNLSKEGSSNAETSDRLFIKLQLDQFIQFTKL